MNESKYLIPEFSPTELRIVGERPSNFGPPTPLFDYPVSLKENMLATYAKKPIWEATGVEQIRFSPKCNPDNIARAFVFDATQTPRSGGTDMFGVEWEYIPQVGGSMVRPGKPLIGDANELKDKMTWPDIEKWDWNDCAEANIHYLSADSYNTCIFLNGWYERLISLMDFEGAVVAMIDDDQKDAVKAFFDQLSDLYIRIFDKYLRYFPLIDGFCIHDDWGSQKETFFSPATVEEMIVPYMKRVTDYLHARGKICELHSCGQLMKQVPNIIAAGWDSWSPQAMNDTHKIYELYGDKLLVAVIPEPFDPDKATDEEQREAARKFADKFCRTDRPSLFNPYGARYLTTAFHQELYKHSRINYASFKEHQL